LEVCPPFMVFPLPSLSSETITHFRNSLYTKVSFIYFITACGEIQALLMGVTLLIEERIPHNKRCKNVR